MKYLNFPFCLFLLFPLLIKAQTKEITLEAIWNGTFRTKKMDELHPMKDGKHYSVFNFNSTLKSTTVDIYEYKTLKKVKTLVSSFNIPELNYFTGYQFSKNEQKILLVTGQEYIYRRSTKALYYVYDVKSETVNKVSNKKIQEPTFSPDGKKIAFAMDNNLFIKDLKTNKTKKITFDGEKNKIINGITDWVYEEEFSFVRAFEWNKTSDKIAFIRFNESNVPKLSMDVYGKGLYQTQQVFKYPKAGEPNATVSLHIYNLRKGSLSPIKVSKKYGDFYIPRIKWTNDPDILTAQFLTRKQNELDLWFLNTKSNTSQLILEEKDAAYVDVTSNLTFLKNNSFIWTSEKDNYNHIYHYSEKGDLIHQVTSGKWEVTDYYGYNEKNNRIYYQSTENGSINRDVYSIGLNGKNKKQLTKEIGTNAASFSADFSYFINTFSSVSAPTRYSLNNPSSGFQLKLIEDNSKLSQNLSEYKISKKEFSTIKVNDNDLNMWVLKPANFNPNKKYPLFMIQYSGPGSQKVANTWNSSNDYWFQYLAQKGYIVACVDGRGTGFKGAKFKKVTQNNLGKYEVEDQIAAAKQLGALPYIDNNRIGIWGWSYGGFMSANCLFKGADTFKMGIAVAPVSSWRFYDTIYTERYLGTPQDNPAGYDNNSPINHVDKLKGYFLLIHGSADDNVHVQNTMQLAEALIQANKQFEWAIYPDKNHGIYGGNTRLHLYRKMTNFIEKTLGEKVN